ncbi:MAG: ABC transporter permease [Chloroflexi bacterium]|nr:ABC transporter permease [Chloroflexota bacterium]
MSRPASPLRAAAALAGQELRLTARRGENVLVTLVVPIAVLLFFAAVGIVPAIAGRPVDFLLPGALALAVIASGLVNLGIATAYERSYGVLKRLGGSPLPRGGLVAAKVAAVLALEVVQVVLLIAVASLVLGWRPASGASLPLLVIGLLAGTLAFSGLGLLLAGTLRAEATLALANGLFLAFLMLGGVVLPVDHLPAPLQAIAGVLPAAALSDVLRVALGGAAQAGDAARPLEILALWGFGAAGLAVRTFRWE